MRHYYSFITLFLTSWLIVSVHAHLDDDIDTLLVDYPHINVGIQAVSLSDHTTLYKRNNLHGFTPASNTKLFTAAAALWHLGGNFRFETLAITTPEAVIKNNILHGDLFFKFSGDPNLTLNDLKQLISSLQKKFTRITGNIYIDISYYDDVFYAPGTSWDDHYSCFSGAPTSSVIINRNCFQQTFNDEVTYFVNSDPEEYIISALRQLLDSRITLEGSLLLGITPAAHTVITQSSSPTLLELLFPILKNSNNLYADTLFKHLGASYFDRQATWPLGSDAVTAVLNNQGLFLEETLSLYDGSGLSRYNLLTPDQITRLLLAIYQDETVFNDFSMALAAPGESGTLRSRLDNYQTRAKTGSLTHVSTLSGYLHKEQTPLLAYSIMINGFIEKKEHYKSIEDSILDRLQHYLVN